MQFRGSPRAVLPESIFFRCLSRQDRQGLSWVSMAFGVERTNRSIFVPSVNPLKLRQTKGKKRKRKVSLVLCHCDSFKQPGLC